MSSGLQWSVKTPSGVRLTLLPPGVSDGAETNPECYRVYRITRGRRSVRAFGYYWVDTSRLNQTPGMMMQRSKRRLSA